MAKLVIFNLEENQDTRTELVLTTDQPISEVRRLAKMFCGKGWIMNRRPDLHTFGSIALAVRETRGK